MIRRQLPDETAADPAGRLSAAQVLRAERPLPDAVLCQLPHRLGAVAACRPAEGQEQRRQVMGQ